MCVCVCVSVSVCVYVRVYVCVCVCVALVIQNAMRIRHIVIYGLPRSTIFLYIISYTARFKKKKVAGYKMCFDFLYNFCLKYFSFYEELSEI